MESTDSSGGSPQPNLPPGFRFHPTDEELVVHYLKKKAANLPLPVSIIAEIDLYKFDPWELPAKATFGEQEWYFFSPRERKYPNGARPNRAATTGYWKATGTDKPIISSGGTQKVGVKKALVFYGGKPPKGVKTNWIMHEYRLVDNKSNSKPPGCDPANKKANSLRLDDWVLCRIYKKNNPPRPIDHERYMDSISMGDVLSRIPPSSIPLSQQNPKLQAIMLENDRNLFEEMIANNQGININSTGYNISQLGTTSNSNKPHIPLRSLPSLFWSDDNGGGHEAVAAKRFREDGNEGAGCIAKADENASIATLLSSLNQLPQNPVLHQQTMMGSLGDGVFRSWYS
ncbi:hypothetical protein RHGRI_018469 [Rhododendron griersonianum]|uniref:NAC domain-containing protein n=1 Tax=Rhododendron griersonianum TaxID=479676 RepID=A0AAV6K1P3_9ERIC|nr:hypothetical protein RHGRI_018469 [Rhododendron griersonianum]